jgi:hypothetical protein
MYSLIGDSLCSSMLATLLAAQRARAARARERERRGGGGCGAAAPKRLRRRGASPPLRRPALPSKPRFARPNLGVQHIAISLPQARPATVHKTSTPEKTTRAQVVSLLCSAFRFPPPSLSLSLSLSLCALLCVCCARRAPRPPARYCCAPAPSIDRRPRDPRARATLRERDERRERGAALSQSPFMGAAGEFASRGAIQPLIVRAPCEACPAPGPGPPPRKIHGRRAAHGTSVARGTPGRRQTAALPRGFARANAQLFGQGSGARRSTRP